MKEKNILEDADLLQNFVEYSTINKSPFKKSEIYNWIVRNNKKIVDYYNKKKKQGRHITYTNRVHGQEKMIIILRPYYNWSSSIRQGLLQRIKYSLTQ